MLAAAFIFSACRPATAPLSARTELPPAIIIPTSLTTPEIIPDTPTAEAETVTTLPPEQPDRPLTLCLASGVYPAYRYSGTALAQDEFLGITAPHPIELRNFEYHTRMLEKLPSLDDGDAFIEQVIVSASDLIVDDKGQVVPLQEGVIYRPSGCLESTCAEIYAGGEVQMGRMVVNFHLLPDLKWSDGTPLIAQDSVYAYHFTQLAHDEGRGFFLSLGLPDGAPAGLLERTADYLALDSQTVQWIGLPGYLHRYYFLNFLSPLPKHLGDVNPASIFDPKAFVGWGPFRVVTWQEGKDIILERNTNYYDADMPRLDEIRIRFIKPGEGHALVEILNGECDVADFDSLLQGARSVDWTLPLYFGIQELEKIQVVHSPGFWDGIAFNTRSAFFDDPSVRQAIAYGTDRETIAEVVVGDASLVARNYLPDNHPLYAADINSYPFSAERARELLVEAGWQDMDNDGIVDREGQPFAITLVTSRARAMGAAIFQQNMAEIGIKVQLAFLSPRDLYAESGPLAGRRFDLFWGIQPSISPGVGGNQPACSLFLTSAIPQPDQIGQWEFMNLMEYSNPAFDTACQQGLTSLDPQEAKQGHVLAQQLFSQDLPILPLYFRPLVAIASPEVTGLQVDHNGAITNFEMLDIQEDLP
ncbi:MAG: ABC transporter substrate-binding protein [Anaerolineales bacterium]